MEAAAPNQTKAPDQGSSSERVPKKYRKGHPECVRPTSVRSVRLVILCDFVCVVCVFRISNTRIIIIKPNNRERNNIKRETKTLETKRNKETINHTQTQERNNNMVDTYTTGTQKIVCTTKQRKSQKRNNDEQIDTNTQETNQNDTRHMDNTEEA